MVRDLCQSQRRAIIFLAGLSGVLAVLPAEAGETAEPSRPATLPSWSRPGEDWPAFLGPTANGRSSLRGIVQPWPEAGPRQCWQLGLGEGYCSPAVAEGLALVFDRIGEENRLRCLVAETGRPLWESRTPTDYADMFGYDGGPRAAPVIAGDRVVTFGAEGLLTCWSLWDGRRQWQVDTTARYQVIRNFFGVAAAPLIFQPAEAASRTLVIVQVGGSPPDSAPADPQRLDLVRGLDSGLVAFDLKSGAEVWRTTAELASYSTPVLTQMAGAARLLAWMRDRLLLVDPATGTVHDSFPWRADELFSVVAASPVVRGSQVLLSETYGPGSVLLEIRDERLVEVRRDPARSRSRTALRAHWATPVLGDGVLYGSSGRNAGDALLACADWDTGQLRWTERGLGRASCTLVDGHLIVLGEFGDLLLIRASPDACQIVSRCRLVDPDRGTDLLAPPCWAAAVIAHGYLYVRGAGRLVCLDLLGG